MKKILFGIFAIVLFTTSAYCDNEQTLINTNVSYQDILDHEIRVDAVRNILVKYGANDTDKIISRILKEIKRNGKITVGSFYKACLNKGGLRSGFSAWTCQEMVEPIIIEHNRLVLESTNNGPLTEEQFNNLYRNVRDCPTIKVADRGRPDLCRSQCIQYAISTWCKLITYYYYNDRKYEGCFCNVGYEDGVVNFEYTPTYDDYIKGIN